MPAALTEEDLRRRRQVAPEPPLARGQVRGRVQGGAKTPTTRYDFPLLEKLLAPAPPSTGYTRSTSGQNLGGRGGPRAPAVPLATAGAGASIIPVAQAAPQPTVPVAPVVAAPLAAGGPQPQALDTPAPVVQAPNVGRPGLGPIGGLTNAAGKPITRVPDDDPFLQQSVDREDPNALAPGVIRLPGTGPQGLQGGGISADAMETANRRIREGKVGGGTFSVLQGVTPEEQAKRDAVVAGIERQIPSSPALSQARQAAAGRGDFEAVDRSFLNPEERAERRLVRSLAGSSRRDAPAALEAVGRLQGQRTEAAFGQQKLESGALALGQQKRLASMLNQLGELDPKDEQGRATLIENILAFQPGKSKQPPTPSYRSVEIPTGQIDPITGNPITRAALYDSTTGQVGPPLTVPPAPGGAGAEAYGSREEIRAAYQAGQLTREQAKALLQK